MPAETEEFFPTAVKAVKEAGKLVMEYYNRLRPEDIQQKAQSDYVTKADLLAEDLIEGIIREDFPDHEIQGEEGGERSTPAQQAPHDHSRYRWIIDPLDGTTNYLHGFPMFSISIAMAKDGQVILGIVYDPLRDEMFWSQKGMGTWINRDQVQVSGEGQLKGALIATGFPFRHRKVFDIYLKSFASIFEQCGSIRRAGSAALDLAYVASSRVDGFWEYGLSPWDLAAGSLLVREAGGIISDLFGKPDYLTTGHVVAGTPAVHEQLVRITSEIYAALR